MNKYPIGSSVQVRVKFRSRDNNGNPDDLTDPTTVVWKYSDPDGNVTTTTSPTSPSAKVATGIYTIDIPTDQVGIWRVRCTGTTSNVATIREGSFLVEGSTLG